MSRTPEITHRIMSAIKSKNTKPELKLRKALWGQGFRYRVNMKNLPGKPDIVFTKAKVIVFCDGDFWHGHNWAVRGLNSLDEELEQYTPFWKDKITRNINRDKQVTELLTDEGWTVIRIWESDINSNLEECVNLVKDTYRKAMLHNIN